MPRADLLPSFTTEISEMESTSNPLELRGGGEDGTTPALGAVVNAVVDALAYLGGRAKASPIAVPVPSTVLTRRRRRWSCGSASCASSGGRAGRSPRRSP